MFLRLAHFIILLQTCLLLTHSLQAKTVVGKYAGEFLTLGVGARYLAMGGTSSAFVSDIHASYWNPAGLANLQYPQIALMHASSFANLVSYDYAGVAFPMGTRQTIGISLVRLGISEIADTRNAWDPETNDVKANPNQYITFFDAADYAFFLSYSNQTLNHLKYGFNVKAIHRSLGSVGSALGLGFDIGLMYAPTQNLSLGLNVQDVTTTFLAWDSGYNELISPTVKMGISYQFFMLGGKFIFAQDYDTRFEGRARAAQIHIGAVSIDIHTGMEYEYKNTLCLRTGIDDIGKLTLGAGLKLSELQIDYCYSGKQLYDETGEAHRVSLHIKLKLEKFKR